MRPVSAMPIVLFAATLFAAPVLAGEPHNFEDAALHAVQFVDKSEGWAVGDDGVIWHTIDAGKVWEARVQRRSRLLRSVCFLNPYFGWIAGREELADGGSAGVLLCTPDGGVTWKRVLANTLPGLNAVRFADDKTGYLLGDGSDQYPSGLFVTRDGGRNWQPVPGPRVPSWLAGDFAGKGGALAGVWNRLGTVRNGKAYTVDMDSLGGRNIYGVRLDGKTGVAVGQGGLVLTTNALDRAGTSRSWVCRRTSLMIGISAPSRRRQAILGGRSAGVGGAAQRRRRRHREVQHTGQPLPLNAVYFADERHGWAVGELGSVLATTDGGKNWQVQRRGGQRGGPIRSRPRRRDAA